MKIKIIIITVLMFFLIYSIVASKNNQKYNNDIIVNIKNSLDIEKKRGLVRDYFLNLELKYNDYKISDELNLIDEKGNIFRIKEKLNTKKIIFRYSELQCNVCVEKQIQSLKRYKDKIGVDNILIIADYSNFRNLIVFKKINSLDIPVYNLSKKMSLEIEKKDIPYFFIADNSLVAKDYFIPIKEIKNYTDNYLNTMYIKHFKSK